MAAPAAKPEDLQHMAEDQLRTLKYCINDNPPWVEAITHGFQHYIVMLGAAVMIPSILVPLMGGTDHDKAKVIQSVLFVSGINTLLQTTLGSRLPTVVGSSFSFILPTITIIQSPSLLKINNDHQRFLKTMRAIQGATMAGCTIHIILGFSGLMAILTRFLETMRAIQGAYIATSSFHIILGFGGLWGIVSRFFTPLMIAPTITMVGLGLFREGFPGVGKCIEVGLPQVIIILAFSQFLKNVKVRKVPIFELYPIILGIAVVWAYAHLLTISGAYDKASVRGQQHCRTDRANIIEASPWIRIPYPLQWGAPSFDAGHAFGLMAGAFAALVESTADYYAVARLSGATPPPPYVISRGVGWQGIGILIAGMFGTTTGSTISPENVGVLGITRVGSRRVVQISAGFMIVFSLLGKFGAIFASIPQPIVAAVFCVVFGVVAGSGISQLQFINLNSARNVFIIGFAVFMATSVPEYFAEFRTAALHGPVNTGARWFNDVINVIFSSGPVIALVITAILDNTMNTASPKDRGIGWWERFRTFDGDTRNLEFYKLPLGLNKFFPPT